MCQTISGKALKLCTTAVSGEEPVRKAKPLGPRAAWASKLPGFGQFYFNAQLDFGQDRVEAGVAGGGFEVGGGVAQPAHRGGVEIAGQQPDLEVVQHVERALATLHRAPAALDRILLDALQGQQRIDVYRGLRRGGGAGLGGRCRVRQRKAGRTGSPGMARGGAEVGAVRSVDAHRVFPQLLWPGASSFYG